MHAVRDVRNPHVGAGTENDANFKYHNGNDEDDGKGGKILRGFGAVNCFRAHCTGITCGCVPVVLFVVG